MATITMPGMLLKGDHASRPTASTVGKGTLYACSDHKLIYQTTDGSTWVTWADATGSGSLSDHTHAATGSGATGGGATLSPGTLNLSTTAPATTEGRIGWDGTLRALRGYDSVQAKHLSAVGWAPFAVPDGVSGFMEFNVASAALAAVSGGNGGALGMWIPVTAPMKLESYAVWCANTASARTAEMRLYVDRLNTSTSLDFVAGTDATLSFTPSAQSRQVSSAVSGAPVIIPPGRYFLVIRNTSTSQAFNVGRTTAATNILVKNVSAQLSTASIAALGSTLDITTLSSKGDGIYGLMMLGRIGGQASAW